MNSLIDLFWESVPPAWFRTRAEIRRAAAERVGLTVEQFQALRRIRRGIDSVSAIAADKNSSRPAVSLAVDGLVQRGLVERQTDQADRRHIRLTLTESGQQTLNAIYQQTETWLNTRFANLTPAERQTLEDGLHLLRQTLVEKTG